MEIGWLGHSVILMKDIFKLNARVTCVFVIIYNIYIYLFLIIDNVYVFSDIRY